LKNHSLATPRQTISRTVPFSLTVASRPTTKWK